VNIPACVNKFKAFIVTTSNNFQDMDNGRFIMYHSTVNKHETFLSRTKRCHGSSRDIQKSQLAIDGITNTLSKNIIYNEHCESSKGIYIFD
jgi:hypothetical protein